MHLYTYTVLYNILYTHRDYLHAHALCTLAHIQQHGIQLKGNFIAMKRRLEKRAKQQKEEEEEDKTEQKREEVVWLCKWRGNDNTLI